ncbi:MAG TPA: multicopper oxidase domain-containing protein [Steroidobacteraceae bacterium]|jgi:FtsP/CotA-like multicopper oxidase with cupredoxin domain|nr:multicopper oxidase domain-containing protein [Steroidobacteraceae bacterium]
MGLTSPVAIRSSLLAALIGVGQSATVVAHEAAVGHEATPEICPRPAAGAVVEEPEDLRSENGVLKVELTVRNEKARDGSMRFCYLLADGAQSPTLRLNPGDLLILSLKNSLADVEGSANEAHAHLRPKGASDPCKSGVMTITSANLHFHGLSIPALCHQDEVLQTSIQPNAPSFEYRFRIPDNEPPGLYWYHPHIHGFSSRQVLGGASGALVVEGIERATPEVAGLPERILVIRDQDLLNPDAPPSPSEPAAQALIDRDGDAGNNGTGWGKPAKDLSVNFVPVPYPEYPRASINVRPSERQLWRVLNASSVTYLNLTALYKRGSRFRPEWIGVAAIDGVPLSVSGKQGHAISWRDGIVVSPGSRVEFILTAPPAGVPAMLVTRTVNTGQAGENDPNRALVSIIATAEAAAPRSSVPKSTVPPTAQSFPWLGDATPVRVRKLYFTEDPADPKNPGAAKFYLTVDGQMPAAFDPASTEPNIVAKQGDVEDWVIENRTNELHAFHIHQIHFQVRDWAGLTVNETYLRDTVNVPFFDSTMKAYPSLTLRMDFRDPNTVGTFIYHCHLLDHEDGGMMGLIRVEPNDSAAVAGAGAHGSR